MTLDYYITIVAASGLFIFLALFIVSFVGRYNQQQRQFESEKRHLELTFQKEATLAQLEMSEQLLMKISQEIHDNIGASLTLAKMQLALIDASTYQLKANRTIELLTRSIEDLRNLSKSINGSYILDQGLENAIQRELEIIHSSGTMMARFVSQADDLSLSNDLEIVIFRAIQESLNNALKHSQGSEIEVHVVSTPIDWTFKVIDNGKGMRMEQVTKSVGLNSLKARMQAVGGRLEIQTELNGGTVVNCILPKSRGFIG
jgi:signal transduction histidine kinase